MSISIELNLSRHGVAVVGDTGIQAAVDTGAKLIIVPPGDHLVASTVTVAPWQTIRGVGAMVRVDAGTKIDEVIRLSPGGRAEGLIVDMTDAVPKTRVHTLTSILSTEDCTVSDCRSIGGSYGFTSQGSFNKYFNNRAVEFSYKGLSQSNHGKPLHDLSVDGFTAETSRAGPEGAIGLQVDPGSKFMASCTLRNIRIGELTGERASASVKVAQVGRCVMDNVVCQPNEGWASVSVGEGVGILHIRDSNLVNGIAHYPGTNHPGDKNVGNCIVEASTLGNPDPAAPFSANFLHYHMQCRRLTVRDCTYYVKAAAFGDETPTEDIVQRVIVGNDFKGEGQVYFSGIAPFDASRLQFTGNTKPDAMKLSVRSWMVSMMTGGVL